MCKMSKIQPLEIKYKYGKRTGIIYPVLIQDSSNLILVDTGLVNQLHLLEDAAKRIGISLTELT